MISMISIHVPAWGTTTMVSTTDPAIWDFNPRSRVGNDETPDDAQLQMLIFQSTFPRGERPGCRR